MAAQGTCRSSGPLQRRDSEFGGCPASDSGRSSSLGDLALLPGSPACWTPAHFRTLGFGTFEVQHEPLPQAWVWGTWRCLELQREVGPRGEEAAARLRSPQLGQDSGAGTVPIEQSQHVPFAHIQAAGGWDQMWGLGYDRPLLLNLVLLNP